MNVITAKIQTVEEIYRLLWTSLSQRRPLAAIYDNRRRLLCPHRLGRNAVGQLRALCYQYGGDSESGLQPAGSAANWRCIAVEKLCRVEFLDETWHTAPNHSRPGQCIKQADIDVDDYPVRDPQNGQ